MKNLAVAAATALSLVALPAQAEHGYRRDGRHHHREDDNSSLWAGVAIIGAIAGLAILADNDKPERSQPVYVEPPYPAPTNYGAPPVATNVWYFCPSSGMYYPYTKACPEGWQTVPAGAN